MKIFQTDFKFDTFKHPTRISYILKKSFYLLSWKLLKVFEFEIFPNGIQLFSKTPFHLFKWKKSCHLLSRVSYLKRIWIHGEHKSKMKVWESPFILSHLTFKKFRISLNQSINQNYLFVYNIPKFRILGCYKPTTLKMNLVLEIRRG